MVVATEIILLIILLALVLYLFRNLVIDIKSGLGKNDSTSETGSLKPLPRAPWWCLALMGRSIQTYLHYVKSINVITEQGIGKLSCPYTQAFILEVLRMNPVALVSLPHSSTEDASVGDYFIEKGSMLFLNIHGIHHDPTIWGDPQNFRPERFLSENGKVVVKREAMCIFSLGQRRCPGEQFARDVLFLFVSAICQRFILKPDPSLKSLPRICEVGSGINAPSKFNMVAITRSHCNKK